LSPGYKFVLISLSFAACFAAAIAIYEIFYLGYSRAGVLFNPINFGIGSGLILLFLFWSSNYHAARFYALAAIFSAFAIFASGSRGPILAVFSCGGILLLTSDKIFSKKFLRSYGFLVFLIVFIFGIAVLGWRFKQDFELESSSSSIGIRFQLWSAAISQILQTPLTGIGADQAGPFLSDFTSQMKDFTHVHNTALNIGLEQGLPGLIAWGWMFAVLAWCTRSYRIGQRYFISFGSLSVIYFFVCALIQDILSHAYLRQLFSLAVSLALASVISFRDPGHQSSLTKSIP